MSRTKKRRSNFLKTTFRFEIRTGQKGTKDTAHKTVLGLVSVGCFVFTIYLPTQLVVLIYNNSYEFTMGTGRRFCLG